VGCRESSRESPPAKAGVTPLEASSGPAAGRHPPLLHGVHVADEQPELHGAGLGVPPGAGGEEQVVAGDAQGALHCRQPRTRQQHVLHRRRLDQLGELHGGAGVATGTCCGAGGRKGKRAARAGKPLFPLRHAGPCSLTPPLRVYIAPYSVRSFLAAKRGAA